MLLLWLQGNVVRLLGCVSCRETKILIALPDIYEGKIWILWFSESSLYAF